MIGKLQGIIDHVADDHIILMTSSGVGYKVFVPANMDLSNKDVVLWIETIVREDSFRLFGFNSIAGLDLFNRLTTVPGVGPKVAMAVLGAFKTETLLSAIATGDAKTITAAPGVGKKVAEKIILELKGKNLYSGIDSALPHTDDDQANTLPDLLSALESLGYRRMDILEMAQKLVRSNPDSDVGTLVRLALKDISGK